MEGSHNFFHLPETICLSKPGVNNNIGLAALQMRIHLARKGAL